MAVRRQWPAVVLTLFNQVQLVATLRAVLHLPQATVGAESQAVRGTVAGAPRFSQSQVRARERCRCERRERSFAFSVSAGGSMTGTVAEPILPAMGLPGAGLPSSVSRRTLPRGWFGSCAGVKRWRSPDGQEEVLLIRRESHGCAKLAALPTLTIAPDDLQAVEARRTFASASAWRAPRARLLPPAVCGSE